MTRTQKTVERQAKEYQKVEQQLRQNPTLFSDVSKALATNNLAEFNALMNQSKGTIESAKASWRLVQSYIQNAPEDIRYAQQYKPVRQVQQVQTMPESEREPERELKFPLSQRTSFLGTDISGRAQPNFLDTFIEKKDQSIEITSTLFRSEFSDTDVQSQMAAILNQIRSELPDEGKFHFQFSIDSPNKTGGKSTKFKNMTARELIEYLNDEISDVYNAYPDIGSDQIAIKITWM